MCISEARRSAPVCWLRRRASGIMACQAQEAAADAGTTEGGVERFRQPSPEDSPGRFRPRSGAVCMQNRRPAPVDRRVRPVVQLPWRLEPDDRRQLAEPDGGLGVHRLRRRCRPAEAAGARRGLPADRELALRRRRDRRGGAGGRGRPPGARERAGAAGFAGLLEGLAADRPGPSNGCSGAISPGRRRSRRSRPSLRTILRRFR